MAMLKDTVCLLLIAAVSSTVVKRQDTEKAIDYRLFHVESLIVSRYAVTSITSVVRNTDLEKSKELDFRVQLPDTAFISNFSMSVNGRTYYGVAKEKEEAEKEFEDRISAGENAGLVQSRGSDVFSVRINTAANSEATFVLQYEELIVRRQSTYSHRINLNPGSVVEDVQVTIRVVDPQGVVQKSSPTYVSVNQVSEQEVLYSYQPTENQQMEDSTEFGLGRDLAIEFDISPTSVSVGEFVVDNNCYFAQFYAGTGATAVQVDLVFVIDVSGSMSGTKISQTRQALETIINQLRATDRFTMLTFSDNVKYWQTELVLASEYRQEGVNFARSLRTEGSTNFNAGLVDGAAVLKEYGMSDHVPLLVMLTDGEPTSGVIDENAIVKNAANALAGTSISLNCLGFGQSLNFQLLERLSLQNNGIVRRIYEGSDASQQLEGFFNEISSPVLKDIIITYDQGSVTGVSTREFALLFEGGEIVVAGQCDKDRVTIGVEVTGIGADGRVTYNSQVSTSPSSTVGGFSPSTERLLAYLRIQQLLDSQFALTDQTAINTNLEKALQLSLEYNFVTELTSLIVVEELGGEGSEAGNESAIGNGGDDRNGLEVDAAFPGGGGTLDVDHGTTSASSVFIDSPNFLLLLLTQVLTLFCLLLK